MNVIIFAINYAPLNKVGSRRIVSYANGFAEGGDNVIVITNKKSSFDGNLEYTPYINSKVNLMELPFLKDKKENKSTKNIPKSRTVKYKYLRKLNQFIRWNILGALFHPYDLWYYKNKNNSQLLEVIKNTDLILSSYGPAAPVYFGAYAKRINPKAKWIIDYRDLWSNIPTEKLLFPFSKIQQTIEHRIASSADGFITVSNGVKKHLQQLFPDKAIEVVFNGFEDETVDVAETQNNNIPIIRYIGTIYTASRDPMPFFYALKQYEHLSNKTIVFEFYGLGAEAYKKKIQSLNLKSTINFCGMVSANEALEKIKTSDGLLLIERSNKEFDGTLTAKVFDYLQSTRPVIAMGINEKSELGYILKETRISYICNYNEDLIIQALVNISNCSENKANVQFIKTFSRKRQFKKLNKFAKRLVFSEG